MWLRRRERLAVIIISSLLYRNGQLLVQEPNIFPSPIKILKKDSNLVQDKSCISGWSVSCVRMEIYGKIKTVVQIPPRLLYFALMVTLRKYISKRRIFNGICTISEFSTRCQHQEEHFNSVLIKKLLKKPSFFKKQCVFEFM